MRITSFYASITTLVLLTGLTISRAELPANARVNAPILQRMISEKWPSQLYQTSIWLSQAHVESCVTDTSQRCWSPSAELKTSREYGFGIPQITITQKFNRFEELKRQFKELSDWKWEDRYHVEKQLLSMVLTNRFNWIRVAKLSPADHGNQTALTLVTYNSGYPLVDYKLCKSIKGCDATRWFGNIELHSMKSKTPLSAYGHRSMFEISREYPRKVMYLKRSLYREFDHVIESKE